VATPAASPLVVIGAGVVGLSTGLYLRRSGRDVVVIDPLPPPGSVSGGDGAGGAVAPPVSADRAGLSQGRQRSPAPPVGVERMLRIYFLQHGFNLSEPATETFQGSWKTLIPAAKSWS
jgi:glycine/D-amino acid oxidase-like deaminating enzyme